MALSPVIGRIAAAGMIVVAPCAALAENDGTSRSPATEQAADAPSGSDVTSSIAPGRSERPVSAKRRGVRSGEPLQRQTEAVRTGCFPPALVSVLDQLRDHFGAPVVVTSGYRSSRENRRAGGARHSLHMHCLAADVQIAGVAPSSLARYAKSLSDVGGVGTYRHTRSVHVDVGQRKFSWFGRSKGGRIRVAMR